MGIKVYKPYTPSSEKIYIRFFNIKWNKTRKSLLVSNHARGRNNKGRITIRHKAMVDINAVIV